MFSSIMFKKKAKQNENEINNCSQSNTNSTTTTTTGIPNLSTITTTTTSNEKRIKDNKNDKFKINENDTIVEIEWESDIQQRYDLIALYDNDTNEMDDYIWHWKINDEYTYNNNNTNIIRDPNKNYFIKYWRIDNGADNNNNNNNNKTNHHSLPPNLHLSPLHNNNHHRHHHYQYQHNQHHSHHSHSFSKVSINSVYKQIHNYKLKNNFIRQQFLNSTTTTTTTTTTPQNNTNTNSTTSNQDTIKIKLSHFEERNLLKAVDYSGEMFKQYSNWMTNNWERIKDKMVRDLVLPGSHDAATYGIKSNSLRVPGDKVPTFVPNSIVSKWSKTQSGNIFKQLTMGYRYFDLRVAPYPVTGKLYIYHAMFSVPVSEVLDDIVKFMKNTNYYHQQQQQFNFNNNNNNNNFNNNNNREFDEKQQLQQLQQQQKFKKEIILLHWNHLGYLSIEQHQELQSMIKSKLDGMLANRQLGTNVKVGELEFTPIINIYDDNGLKKRVINDDGKKIKQPFDSIQNEPLFWYSNKSLISNYDSNQFHTSKDVISFLSREVTYNHKDRFWVAQCILTIDSKKLLHITTKSLLDWNHSEIPKFLKFFETLEQKRIPTNIIMTDFCTHYPITDYAIRRNINE
ncbi:hypothetical protein ACTA71_010799 [Dictyostelium dimigraforme]